MDKLNKLCEKLNYSFKDMERLKLALTHRSLTGINNNERLEFLGDSILNFLIAKKLYDKFPGIKEGYLTRMRAHLVCEPSLAKIARSLKLNEYVILGVGERKSGGCNKDSILSDALEAILGAILEDSDINTCEKIVDELFSDSFLKVSIERTKDPKTKLQEYLQAQKSSLPVYEIVEQIPKDDGFEFVVSCKSELLDHTIGRGDSRRKAEQQAASNMLEGVE